MIHILIQFPRSPKQRVDRRHRTPVPADGELSPLPFQPEHEFLGEGGGGVAFCGAEDEVEDYVAWGWLGWVGDRGVGRGRGEGVPLKGVLLVRVH